ncbi:MAG: leucine-rich repeat protein, partial [Opitutales bacterium]|nr:leucine-rich repeat protein [Opitutales bacterium]
SNLTAILVDAANPSFASQSGLLYNKALSSLIACPGGSEGALSVPSGTVEIGHGAFESCAKLTSIHLPASVQVFEGIDTLACRALSAFTVDEENSTLKAENGVLFSKDSLTLVRCPEGKTGTISIPSDVTTVAPYAFQGCTLLTGELSLPSGLNTIGDYAFNNCTGLSGTLAIPAGVTSIGEFAFNYCIGLSGSLELPSGLTSIGQFAFANCSGFTGSLVIPSGVTEIEGVFAGCSGLTSVTIPGGVTSLPDYAFGGCSALESVTFLGNAPTMGDFVFGYGGYNQPVGLKLYYIAGASGFTTPTWYGFPCEEWVEDPVDPNWSYSSAIGEVTIIGYSGAGHNLVIPATIDGLPVTAIAEVAFLERTDLSGSFTLGANVSSIGSSAFWGCTNLTGFVVDGANATYASVDGVLFSKDLSTLLLCAQGKTGTCSIPSGTDSIESGAFSGCQTVTSLVVDGANATYASVDGVLFSKDLSTLLLCPQGKAGSYAIPSGTDSIESGAF